MISVFFNIIIKSLKADKTFYKDDNNFNEAAIYFALIIMLIVSIISIIPNSVFLEFFSAGFNIGSIKGPNLRSIIIGAAIIWTIKTVYLYFIGTVLFPSKLTKCNFRKIFITVGYAHSPLLFNAFVFDTSFFYLIFVTYIWYNATLIVGINQILNYKNIFKSAAIVLAPIIILILFTVSQFLKLSSGTIS